MPSGICVQTTTVELLKMADILKLRCWHPPYWTSKLWFIDTCQNNASVYSSFLKLTAGQLLSGQLGVNLTNWRHFLYVCPVIDHEFRHHLAKVAVDSRGDSRVDPLTTLTMLWRNSLSITTDALKSDINLFFTITDCRISRSLSLTRRTNFKFMCLSAYWP